MADSGVGAGTLSDGYSGNFNTSYGSTNCVDFTGVEHFLLTPTEHGDTLTTNRGNDRVSVGGGRDVVQMGLGDDTLVLDWSGYGYGVQNGVAMGGGISAEGGYFGAFDTLYGSTYRVDFTQVEHFGLTLTDQADAVKTCNGNDTIAAGSGADILVSGKGIDHVDGGFETDLSRGADGWTPTNRMRRSA